MNTMHTIGLRQRNLPLSTTLMMIGFIKLSLIIYLMGWLRETVIKVLVTHHLDAISVIEPSIGIT